jgi:equilibrative nucleoside transporter 1/2/3
MTRVSSETEKHVKDKFNFVYIGFFLYGIGGLMPWNFFITPANYWELKLGTNFSSMDVSNNTVITPNWMQNFWANFLSIFCTGIVFIMSIVMHFRPKSWTKEKMISVSLGVTCLLFLATAFIGLIDNRAWKETFFWVNLLLATVLCAFCAVVQNIGMTMTSGLGNRYVQAFSSGQGMAGVAAAVAYCINLSAAGKPLMAGVTFFFTAAVIAFLTLINHLAVTKTAFYISNNSESEPLIKEAQTDESENSSEPSSPTQKSNSSKWKVIKTCLTEIYSVFITLFVTLSVFPGVCASIQSSSDDEFSKKWFSPILTMLLYNFGDTLGRLATAMIQINKSSKKTLVILATLRVVFIFIFPMCHIERVGGNVPTIIEHDWIYAIIMLIFSISNGWITTICFTNAPQRFAPFELELRETSEEMVFTGLTSGLITGSLMSFVVKAVTVYA